MIPNGIVPLNPEPEKIMAAKNDDTVEIEVWVMVDACGDYAVGTDEDSAKESYSDGIGATEPARMVKVILTVPKPKAVTLRGTVPAETEGEFALAVA